MISETVSLVLLIISLLTNLVITFVIMKRTHGNQLQKYFLGTLICISICLVGQICQILFSKKYNIQPVYFDYFVYIGTVFLPVFILLTGLTLYKTKIDITNKIYLLFVVPIITLLVIWTNDLHHLFYINYSTSIADTDFGIYSVVHNFYSYLLLGTGIYYMIKAAINNSGFFSKQSMLIILGISFPILINLLGTLKIFPMTIYLTPISFTLALLFISISIFKFNFLGVAPIALSVIVNKISDSYVVLNDNYEIIDYNETFINTFKIHSYNIRNKTLTEFVNHQKLDSEENLAKMSELITEVEKTRKTKIFEKYIPKIRKYFSIEIYPLVNKNSYLGTLLLLKNITQHKEDILTIKENQNQLLEQERLASLGQLIGGISHNLKTPIMSIAGASEGLTDLINEYDSSIGDPDVTPEDHHAIANDMRDWVDKIHSYTTYMSDVITAVKGQAVTLSEQDQDEFTIDELLKRINILMKHELTNSHVALNVKLNNLEEIKIHGSISSLVQIINNLISNSIQSYKTAATKNTIELETKKSGNQLILTIEDHGCGIPQDVQKKLFKEMITTKGKNGTGLGLFMSYSTIKGKFNGDMTFDSTVGKGTKFTITLPISK